MTQPFNGDARLVVDRARGHLRIPTSRPAWPPTLNGPVAREPRQRGSGASSARGSRRRSCCLRIALGLCEEVPDLAAVLSDLRDSDAGAGGRRAGSSRTRISSTRRARPSATRSATQYSERRLVGGHRSPVQQLDCMQGVQDVQRWTRSPACRTASISFRARFPIYRRGRREQLHADRRHRRFWRWCRAGRLRTHSCRSTQS